MNKKGIFPIALLLNPTILIILAVILLILFAGSSIVLWVLGTNLYKIGGAVIILFVVGSYVYGPKPIPPKVAIIMIIAGLILFIFPHLFKGITGGILSMIL